MEFDIKRGHGSSLEGDGLKIMMKELLGDVNEENGFLVTSFGATKRFEVKLKDKNTLIVNTISDKDASVDTMSESSKKYNLFMEKATGLTSKERSKRLQKKAKEGKL